VVLATSFAVVESVAFCQTETVPHVRSYSSVLMKAISEGRERSETFRRLVETIDMTDGLVYLDEGSCPFGSRACLVLSLTIAGPNRLLRVRVNTRWVRDCELVALIGHELQHAVEVLENPKIRSSGELYQFFDRIGRTGLEAFETHRATRAGDDVRHEVCG
jgi:hypothetical protein